MATPHGQAVDVWRDGFTVGGASDALGYTDLDATQDEVYRADLGVDASAHLLSVGGVGSGWTEHVIGGVVVVSGQTPGMVGGQLAGILGRSHEILR